MSASQVPVKKLWPRYVVSPTGERARVDCPGDIPPEWELEKPLALGVADVELSGETILTMKTESAKRKARA